MNWVISRIGRLTVPPYPTRNWEETGEIVHYLDAKGEPFETKMALRQNIHLALG